MLAMKTRRTRTILVDDGTGARAVVHDLSTVGVSCVAADRVPSVAEGSDEVATTIATHCVAGLGHATVAALVRVDVLDVTTLVDDVAAVGIARVAAGGVATVAKPGRVAASSVAGLGGTTVTTEICEDIRYV